VVVTVVAIVSFKMNPVYQATSRIEIDAEMPQIQSLSDLYRNLPSDDGFLQTQVDVLRSDSLAWKTIEQSQLAAAPEFGRGLKPSNPAPEENWLTVRTRLLRNYKKSLEVEQMSNSRMVEVKFESRDPAIAARVVNTLVHNYV
jgi:uncharacterized protein involved in exopolysaccharide biosynthesis